MPLPERGLHATLCPAAVASGAASLSFRTDAAPWTEARDAFTAAASARAPLLLGACRRGSWGAAEALLRSGFADMPAAELRAHLRLRDLPTGRRGMRGTPGGPSGPSLSSTR